jgi:hypothetical protein
MLGLVLVFEKLIARWDEYPHLISGPKAGQISLRFGFERSCEVY